ncbi:MAG: hypothetical protein IKH38_05915 [Clostridia bacterium]|nr:hypothetical protein [Clostridia bacterium]
MSLQRKPCRCLLAESQPDLALTVAEYIASLPPEFRADEAVYQARLAHCRACDQLFDGTCVLCGCYAEARAAKLRQRCPAVPPRWLEGEPT